MSAPDRLRELAKAAAPGPWWVSGAYVESSAGLIAVTALEHARLIALAPELAEWAAEAYERNAQTSAPDYDLLARLDAILASEKDAG